MQWGEPSNADTETIRVYSISWPASILTTNGGTVRHRVLLSAVAVQAHEREEAVRLSVFRFAIGEAGQSSKPPDAIEAGKHPPIAQDTDVIVRRLYREHFANCGFGSIHRRHPSDVFYRRRGAGEEPAARLAWA
jgi:hypothetical protein